MIIGHAMIAIGLVLIYWIRDWWKTVKELPISKAERYGLIGISFTILIAALALIFGGFELISNDLFWMFF